jgi:predicted neutral ceramidase superfamily lipid hydrolase
MQVIITLSLIYTFNSLSLIYTFNLYTVAHVRSVTCSLAAGLVTALLGATVLRLLSTEVRFLRCSRPHSMAAGSQLTNFAGKLLLVRTSTLILGSDPDRTHEFRHIMPSEAPSQWCAS